MLDRAYLDYEKKFPLAKPVEIKCQDDFMYSIGYLKDRHNVINQFKQHENKPNSIRLYKSIWGKTFREPSHSKKIIKSIIPSEILNIRESSKEKGLLIATDARINATIAEKKPNISISLLLSFSVSVLIICLKSLSLDNNLA